MRLLVLPAAIAMPLVAWLSNAGAFGPDNGTVSARHPTLLVAAGYAFAIWAAAGFLLTTAWMPLFSQEWFWLCLAVIFGATACLARCALLLSRERLAGGRPLGWAWAPLSLHAG